MSTFRNHLFVACVVPVAWLVACASAPPVNSVATVAVQATVTPSDLQAGHAQAIRVRRALQAAGIGNDVVAAGRVVRVACAVMTDGTWGGIGVLPPGARADNDSVWRIRVEDVGDNDREGVNRILEPVPSLTWSGNAAYTFVPNWRELGRITNFDSVPLPSDQSAHYRVVFSRYLVRCGG